MLPEILEGLEGPRGAAFLAPSQVWDGCSRSAEAIAEPAVEKDRRVRLNSNLRDSG
jgi:hypothetical protein